MKFSNSSLSLVERIDRLERKVGVESKLIESNSGNYAIIYFMDRKPLKKKYDTSTKAFSDWEEQGCVYVELFNKIGRKLSSFPSSARDKHYIKQ